MALTYRALALLLSYPTADVQAAAPAIMDAIRSEGMVPAPIVGALEKLAASWNARTSSTSRKASFTCSTGPGRCRSTCMSTFTARAATADRRWRPWSNCTGPTGWS
jgi:hypothetical protein